MDRYRNLLRAKIHRATITDADLEYEGSLTIPWQLMSAAEIVEYESVDVWNVTTGARFRTYAITGEQGSKRICANGAAAHLAKPGDLVIIACFCDVAESQLLKHLPRIVFVNDSNEIIEVGEEVAGPHPPRPSRAPSWERRSSDRHEQSCNVSLFGASPEKVG